MKVVMLVGPVSLGLALAAERLEQRARSQRVVGENPEFEGESGGEGAGNRRVVGASILEPTLCKVNPFQYAVYLLT